MQVGGCGSSLSSGIWVMAWEGLPVLSFPICKIGSKATCLVGLLQRLNELKYTIQEPF